MGGNSFAVDAYVGPIHYKDNYADSLDDGKTSISLLTTDGSRKPPTICP